MERVTFAILLLLLPLAASAAARRHADPALSPSPPPSWPDSFTLSYNFSLPYTREFQSSELVYDVVVHRDADRRLAKQVRERMIDRKQEEEEEKKRQFVDLTLNNDLNLKKNFISSLVPLFWIQRDPRHRRDLL